MSLIKCPRCGRQVDDSCDTCNYCGFPIEFIRNGYIIREARPEDIKGTFPSFDDMPRLTIDFGNIFLDLKEENIAFYITNKEKTSIYITGQFPTDDEEPMRLSKSVLLKLCSLVLSDKDALGKVILKERKKMFPRENNKSFYNIRHYFSSEHLLDFLCESEYYEGYFLFWCGFKKGKPFFEFTVELIEDSLEQNAVLSGKELDDFCRFIIKKCGE